MWSGLVLTDNDKIRTRSLLKLWYGPLNTVHPACTPEALQLLDEASRSTSQFARELRIKRQHFQVSCGS